jgi:hypothetical protein
MVRLKAVPPARLALPLVAALVAGGARAGGLGGAWATPVGTLALVQNGDSVQGTLSRAERGCALPRGDAVFKADVLEDSLSGQLLLCLSGCGKASEWVPALLLVAPDGQKLSGALTLPKGCRPAVATPSAFVAVRERSEGTAVSVPVRPGVTIGPPSPGTRDLIEMRARVHVRPTPDPALRARAQELARDGAAYLDEGRFEKARGRFLEAVKIDSTYAEGYNGIGASYRARNDLANALRYYKRSIQADPTIGDGYYNMACVYALLGKKKLALRYLRIARRNGYVAADTMARDDDLASLRGEAAFRELLGDP